MSAAILPSSTVRAFSLPNLVNALFIDPVEVTIWKFPRRPRSGPMRRWFRTADFLFSFFGRLSFWASPSTVGTFSTFRGDEKSEGHSLLSCKKLPSVYQGVTDRGFIPSSFDGCDDGKKTSSLYTLRFVRRSRLSFGVLPLRRRVPRAR